MASTYIRSDAQVSRGFLDRREAAVKAGTLVKDIRSPKVRPFQVIMDEHVEFPGFPQLITTRGFAYSWLKALGWDESERGFGSLDYTIFARNKTAEPLSDPAVVRHFLSKPEIMESYSRG